MKLSWNQSLIAAVAVLAIAVSGVSLWRTLSRPDAINEALHRGIGRRLAEEVAGQVGDRAKLVVVTLERGVSPVVDAQWAAFKETLRTKPGIQVVATDQVGADKGDKYGPGTGMSARRYLKVVEKHADADAIVSFIGVPDPDDLKPAAGPAPGPVRVPRLFAVGRSPRELAKLFERGTLTCALVPRFSFPSPGPEHPSTPSEWFDNRFQVVTAAAAR